MSTIREKLVGPEGGKEAHAFSRNWYFYQISEELHNKLRRQSTSYMEDMRNECTDEELERLWARWQIEKEET